MYGNYPRQSSRSYILSIFDTPVSYYMYLPCSVMCAVYFLAIFRRNFNGIIVFYVCIINTNSIHASFLVPIAQWPVASRRTVEGVQAGPGYAYAAYARSYDCYSRRGKWVSPYVCVLVCVRVSCVSPRVQDTFAQILIWRQCVRATGNGPGPQRGLSHAAPLRFITRTTNGNLGSYTDTILL